MGGLLLSALFLNNYFGSQLSETRQITVAVVILTPAGGQIRLLSNRNLRGEPPISRRLRMLPNPISSVDSMRGSSCSLSARMCSGGDKIRQQLACWCCLLSHGSPFQGGWRNEERCPDIPAPFVRDGERRDAAGTFSVIKLSCFLSLLA